MGVSNIEITENVIKNHYQGMIVYNVNNIYVNGNNITGTVHNAIAVQSVSSGTSSGNIEIVNNTISNMNERPVRFGALDSATIIVSENTIINAVDEDNEILRTQTCTQTTYTFENNKYNDVLLANESSALNSTNWFVTIDSELAASLIVTPETAQSVLDRNINGKTVYFTEGTYQGLILRSTFFTAKAYLPVLKSNKIDYKYTLGNEVSINNLSNTGVYHYVRDIENVKFVGLEGAVFEGLFLIHSDYFNTDFNRLPSSIGFDDGVNKNPDVNMFDPVRNVLCTAGASGSVPTADDTAYFDHINIDGISFENMNFVGSKGRIAFIYEDYYASLKNVSISNCSFTTDEPWLDKAYAAIYIMNRNGVEDVIVEDSVIENHYQGIMTYNTTNVTVDGNDISGTVHNAIAIQTTSDQTTGGVIVAKKFRGNIQITNNIVSNMSERAIRFNQGEGATIVVSGNTFINCVDADNELLKTQTCTETTYEFENNTYNGVTLDTDSGSLDSTNWIVTIPQEE